MNGTKGDARPDSQKAADDDHDSDKPKHPVLIQVDGPGTEEFVRQVARRLSGEPLEQDQGAAVAVRDGGIHQHTDHYADDVESAGGFTPGPLVGATPKAARRAQQRWTVVWFDAWEYQRLAPPWWWLITTIDRQLHESIPTRRERTRRRVRDYGWRVWRLVTDLLPVLPLIVVAVAAWYVSGRADMFEFGKWASAVIGGVTALGAFLWSAMNVVRRLLLASPISASAARRTSDPMRDLQRRYSYLMCSNRTPVAIVIKNLDRCRAAYVVELLEGIQTALKGPDAANKTPFVAFLVPGSRRWICDSYREVYKEFEQTTKEPGRPFGLAFMEKVFDYALQLPLVPPRLSTPKLTDAQVRYRNEITSGGGEIDIRQLLCEAERGGERPSDDSEALPLPQLRCRAIVRMAVLEADNDRLRACKDTEGQLRRLVDDVGASATVARQLAPMYCVQRTAQFLGGHYIDSGENAIRELGIWTILAMRWPLLAEHLSVRPDDVSLLREQKAPEDVSKAIADVFVSAEVAQFLFACEETALTVEQIRRFTRPIQERWSCKPVTLAG